MNKAVFALVMVGLVVLATTVEAKSGYPGKDKMRMKKEKAMAQKERAGVDKLKDIKRKEGARALGAQEGAAVGGAKHLEKDQISRGFDALKQELDAGEIGLDEFKEHARYMKSQVKRKMAAAAGKTRQDVKEKSRNKRSTADKAEAMKKKRSPKHAKNIAKDATMAKKARKN